jgi:TrpR-related protein YerC/YecD
MQEKSIKDLYQAILSLESEQECTEFFRDLCTVNELKAMSERWQVAKKVNQGTPYRQISEETGASTATITRVAHWLHHGMGGYQLMLKKRYKSRS